MSFGTGVYTNNTDITGYRYVTEVKDNGRTIVYKIFGSDKTFQEPRPVFLKWLNQNREDLEEVFSKENQWYGRIVYDRNEGAYYDRFSDVYLNLSELKSYGLLG